jgi:hypothetical protein
MYTLAEIADHLDPTGEQHMQAKLKGLRDRRAIPSSKETRGRGAAMVFSPLDACAIASVAALRDIDVGDVDFLREEVWPELRREDEDGNAPIAFIMQWLEDRKRYPIGGGLPALMIRQIFNPSTNKSWKMVDYVSADKAPRPVRKGCQVVATLSLDLSVVLQRFTREGE